MVTKVLELLHIDLLNPFHLHLADEDNQKNENQ